MDRLNEISDDKFFNAASDPITGIANAVSSIFNTTSTVLSAREQNANVQMKQQVKSDCGRKPILQSKRTAWNACNEKTRQDIVNATNTNNQLTAAEKLATINATNATAKATAAKGTNTLLVVGLGIVGLVVVFGGIALATRFKYDDVPVGAASVK